MLDQCFRLRWCCFAKQARTINSKLSYSSALRGQKENSRATGAQVDHPDDVASSSLSSSFPSLSSRPSLSYSQLTHLCSERFDPPAPPPLAPPFPPASMASSSKPPKPSKPNHSSLSSIVSHLVRSSLGAAAPSADDVGDDKLDRHVADLLLKEAKEKEKAWGTKGTRAYTEEEE